MFTATLAAVRVGQARTRGGHRLLALRSRLLSSAKGGGEEPGDSGGRGAVDGGHKLSTHVSPDGLTPRMVDVGGKVRSRDQHLETYVLAPQSFRLSAAVQAGPDASAIVFYT